MSPVVIAANIAVVRLGTAVVVVAVAAAVVVGVVAEDGEEAVSVPADAPSRTLT
jgi:hypothetical protein